MKKGLQLALLLLFYSLSISSQVNRSGTPLISAYDIDQIGGALKRLCITMDGRGIMYFGNEKGGITTYDGSSWDIIATPGTGNVTALATDSRGVVYAGGENDFGFLQPGPSGKLTWLSLTERIIDTTADGRPGSVTSIVTDTNAVCFSDSKKLYILSTGTDSLSVINMEEASGIISATALASFDDRIFIADNIKGLFVLGNGGIERIAGGEKAAGNRFVRMLPYDRDNLIIAAAGKGLMLFNIRTGILTEEFGDRRAVSVLRNGMLTDLAILPGNMIAASLGAKGGVYILSHEGKLLQHISEQTTDVRDASVTALYCDHASNAQLWFCTTGFINRASVSMPAGEFGDASGIISLPVTLTGFADSAFVAAETGLYKSFTDRTGVMRFRRIRSQGEQATDLITVDPGDGTVLLCSTPNGLLQIDEEGDATRFLSWLSFTKLRTDRDDASLMVAGSDDGTIRILRYDADEWTVAHTPDTTLLGRITGVEQSAPGEWWFLTAAPASLVRMHCEPNDTTLISYGQDQGIISDTLNSITLIDDRLYLCTGQGIYSYNRQNDAFEKERELAGETFDRANVTMLFRTPEGETVVSGYDTRNFDALVTTTRQGHVVFRRQFDFLPDISTTGIAWIDGSIWLAKGRSLYVIDKSKLAFRYGDFSTIFTRITSGRNNILMDGTFYTETPEGLRIPSSTQPDEPLVRLRHRDNDISFVWSTTSYVDEWQTEYRYRLEGFDQEWSGWEHRRGRDYTNLPAGDYVFSLKTRTITGPEGEDQRYSFTVWKPWYASMVAKLVYFIVTAWMLFILIRYFARRLRLKNQRLESLLSQRNAATARGRNEMAGLEKYAGLIQQSMQPPATRLARAFPNSFVLNRPMSTVSGDFFWVMNRGERTLIAVGDCTGHGVRSSLRTAMALSFLDETGLGSDDMNTSAILGEFRKKLGDTFRALPESEIRQEGIDISLLAIDRASKIVQYSGAASQCFRVREMSDHELARWENGEFKPNEGTMVSGKHLLETVYGDRIPLGMHPGADHEFTQHTWKLERESSYYLFTDGYADQFNGVTGRKFLKRNMRRLILDIRNYPMSRQKEILTERLESWMGKSPQTDDIIVAGLRIE
ncbi:MAG: SpoIIE family protein phosphatase [Bacteroidales bacterium]